MAAFPFLRRVEGGTLVDVYVQPGARRNELAGIFDSSLKLRLVARPIEGAANAQCIELLCALLALPKSQVTIVQGHKSRRKAVLLKGIAPEGVQRLLEPHGITA
jgi:hypothetical protein